MATIPYSYECSKDSGFLMDPNEAKRFGYITELDGFDLAEPLKKDLQVYISYKEESFKYAAIAPTADPSGGPLKVVKVVGVLEKLEWEGGVGSPLSFEFYVSAENAFALKAKQQTALKTTSVKKIGWWIADFDQEQKQWFEQSFPIKPALVTGVVAGKDNPELNVDLNGVFAKDGIDVMVYKVSLKVAPGANQSYALHFANSLATPVAKNWGLVVGTLALAKLPAQT